MGISVMRLRLIFVVGVAILFFHTGCTGNSNHTLFPKETLMQGDIVFRRGTGLASRAVLTIDKKGIYTHVGIVVHEGGAWKVIHAVPGENDRAGEPDRLKMEPVESFFAPEKAVSGAVMSVDADTAIISGAVRHAISLFRRRVFFDHEYDLNDTTKMYCSELVEFVYLSSGLDLVEGNYSEINFPGFSGLYLLPSDILNSKYLKLKEGF